MRARVAACIGILAIAATATFATSHVGRASVTRFPGGPILAVTTYTCTKSITVLFLVNQGWTDPGSISPTPRTCWRYASMRQRPSTYMICHEDGSLNGTGATRVFDDTNPMNDLNTEMNAITFCSTLSGGSGGIYAEYMAARNTDNSTHWCTDNSYQEPCWRRDNASGAAGTISHYFAELYTSEFDVKSDKGNWLATGYGASPSNSSPVYNFLPDRGNPNNVLYNDVTELCGLVGNGGFISLYAGDTNFGTIQPGDQSTINTALNACTST